jgi:SulP family sulfate permease
MSQTSLPIPPALRVGRQTFRNDLTAGLIMAIVSIPNGLGGSALAGVNPVHGLYSLVIGTPVAALFTASVIMNVDATSATALMTRDALAGVPADQVLPALVTLVLLVGLFQVLFGVLRLGSLMRFVSNAVMTGFLTGIATLTILGQVADLTGYASPYSNKVFRLLDTVLRFNQIDVPTLLVGLGTIAAILILNRSRLGRYAFPIALLLATAAVPLLRLDSVHVVGQDVAIPRALPTLHMPDLSAIPEMLIPALAIAITAVVQAGGVSQTFPNPDGRYPDVSRDFLGQGLGNVATGLFGGLPVGGSLSGTAMVTSVGGQSRWANIFTGIFVAVSLLFLAPLISRLPSAALAGMLIVVGFGMLNPRRVQFAWNSGPTSLAVMLITFTGTLLMPIQFAVFLGVVLSILLSIWQSAERVRLMRIVPVDGGLLEAEPPAVLADNELVVLQPVGSLFFAAASELEKLLPEVGQALGAVVILRLRPYDEVGSTFLGVIDRYQARLAANGGRLMLAGVSPRVLTQLEKTGIGERLGRDNLFPAGPRLGDALLLTIAHGREWIEAHQKEGQLRP